MKIECTQGPAQTDIMGHTYRFERNAHGHYVAEVTNLHHRVCLLNASWAYKEYEEPQPEPEPAQDPAYVDDGTKADAQNVPAAEPVGLPQYADDGRDPGDPNVYAGQAANEQPDATDTASNTEEPTDPARDAPKDEGGEPDPAVSNTASADAGTNVETETAGKALEDMSKDELKAEADKRGVKVTARMNKDAIIEAILAAED